ncbi:MAG: hypothetical protein HC807_08475 [Gammaproteobacteria bacterium]|nr:hypothetical protein [Gammaproteobacteria bacterium]
MSRHTNFIAVHARAAGERAKDLPALRKVPQMLAAGWGGSATLRSGRIVGAVSCSYASVDNSIDCSMSSIMPSARAPKDRLVRPGPLRIAMEAKSWTLADVALLRLADLERLSVPTETISALQELLSKGVVSDERSLVAAFLAALLDLPAKLPFTRQARRVLIKFAKDARVWNELTAAITAALARSTAVAWMFDAAALDVLTKAGSSSAVVD